MSDFNIRLGSNQHAAVCSHSDGSGILALFLIPEEADPQAALATLKSGTGFDGTWTVEKVSGEVRQSLPRGRSAARQG